MVPSVMAQWIATVVAPESGVTASVLESKGLGILKVRDLKRIRSSIYATGCVSIPQRIPSSANKNKLVEAIHAHLKMDNSTLVACVHADLEARRQAASHVARVPVESGSSNTCGQSVNSLPPSFPHITSATHRGSKTATASTGSSCRKRQAHQINCSVAPIPPNMSYVGAPYPGYTARALGGFSPSAVHTNPNGSNCAMLSHYQNYLQIQNPIFTAASYPQDPILSLPIGGESKDQQTNSSPPNPQAEVEGNRFRDAPASYGNRSDMALGNSSKKNVAINTTGEGNIPRTPQEVSFFNQLLAMGFQDREEVMRGIRQSNVSSVDEVMMWIIQQREDQEEARKMDEARLRSEQLRKENAEKQKRAFQERLNAATSRDDFRMIYGQSSWVLKNLDNAHFQRLVSHHKSSLVRLLKLESNTRKWYQDKLPACYFRDLCHRSNKKTENEFDLWLMKECDTLESGLYKLELQQGGVPLLFTRAQETHPEYEEQGETDASDDEIVFCGTRQPEAQGPPRN